MGRRIIKCREMGARREKHRPSGCRQASRKELMEERLLIVAGVGKGVHKGENFKEMQKYSRIIKYPLFSVEVNVPDLG